MAKKSSNHKQDDDGKKNGVGDCLDHGDWCVQGSVVSYTNLTP